MALRSCIETRDRNTLDGHSEHMLGVLSREGRGATEPWASRPRAASSMSSAACSRLGCLGAVEDVHRPAPLGKDGDDDEQLDVLDGAVHSTTRAACKCDDPSEASRKGGWRWCMLTIIMRSVRFELAVMSALGIGVVTLGR